MAKKGVDRQDGDDVAARPELSVDLLKPDAKNARRMPKERLSGLKFSMHEYGDLSGITWNEQLEDLIGGHQRMKVLRAAGAKTWTRTSETEGSIVHPKTGEVFKIRIVRWDLEKHRQAQIVANNPHIQGEYTDDVVAQLKELEDSLLFDAMKLDELQSDLDKAAKDAEKELEAATSGASDDSDQLTDSFMIIIECKDEGDQRALLERFDKEGLKCRALT